MVPVLIVGNSGVCKMEEKIVADAKERIKSKFDLSKLKHVVRKENNGYEVEFFPKKEMEVGNGVICYYSINGEFVKMEYTQ
jgi:hypothetical protein